MSFLERHSVTVAVIRESKRFSKSKTPSIQNITTVQKDCHQGQGGGLLTLIHKSINFNAHYSLWYSSSTDTRDTLLENMISGSNFGILNWDSPTRLQGNTNQSSQDVVVVCLPRPMEGMGRLQFHLFSQNCQIHHRLLVELLEHFNVFLYISHYEHYGLCFRP